MNLVISVIYRFSCILKVVEEDIHDKSQPPVKYRVIEHSDYKFIIVIIDKNYLANLINIDFHETHYIFYIDNLF